MKLGIIGSYDEEHKSVCGQSDKTELFLLKFRERLGDENVCFTNMYNWKKAKYNKFLSIIYTFLVSKNIIIMTSVNGTRVLYLFAKLMKTITRKKIYHMVVGGEKNLEIFKKKNYIEIAKRLDGIYVEINNMVEEYNKLGITGVEYIPNCKEICENYLDNVLRNEKPYKFCTYSKVNREKGIPEAIEIIKTLNEQKKIPCILHIYGVIDDEYKEEFNHELENKHQYLNFCGKINREESCSQLSQYYAMLFPTHHPEGVPGALIDAYEAGLPIFSSDSYYMKSIINHGKTGMICKEYDIEDYVNKIEYSIDNNLISKMRKLCYEEVQKYNVNLIINKLINNMQLR